MAFSPAQLARGTPAIVATAILLVICRAPSEAQEKAPLPDAGARDAARKTVRELYAQEFDAARKQAAQGRTLAQTLIATAGDTQDDDAALFVLLNEARELAIAAGSYELALQALDGLETHFDLSPGVQTKVSVQTFSELARTLGTGESNKPAAEHALALVDRAAANGDFDSARRAAEAAASLARKAKDLPLVRKATARQADLRQQEAEYATAQEALARLAADSSDAKANLIVGHYRCFVLGDWEGGVRFLAAGADDDLRKLAAAELAAPEEASAQAAIGDGWWDWAEKLPARDESKRERIRAHARQWYERALPELTGLTRVKAESRLRDSAKVPAGQVLNFRFEKSDFAARGTTVTVRDLSGSGNDGEVIACLPAPGAVGTGLRFDGQKSAVQVPANESLVWEAFTISIWAYFEEENGGEVLVANLDNGRLHNDIFHFMRVQFKSSAGFRGIDDQGGEHYKPRAGRWTHFVAVYDGKRCSLWADGQKVSETREIIEKPGAPTGPLTVGKSTGSFTANYKGVLDELAIYNRALADREIEALYAAVPKDAAGQPIGGKP